VVREISQMEQMPQQLPMIAWIYLAVILMTTLGSARVAELVLDV
jgi:hypothetical protein